LCERLRNIPTTLTHYLQLGFERIFKQITRMGISIILKSQDRATDQSAFHLPIWCVYILLSIFNNIQQYIDITIASNISRIVNRP